MPKFLIEVPHEGTTQACARAIDLFHRTGSHFLTHADCGCMDGEHHALITVEVDKKDEARSILQPALRPDPKPVQLNAFYERGSRQLQAARILIVRDSGGPGVTQSLLDFCLANHDWLLEFIESLVAIESPSDDPAAVNRCGAELASRLDAIGGKITRVPSAAAGEHLRASFGSGPRQILLLGHFDTVWPVGQLARMPLKREGGKLFGPGVFDMKAGIGLAMLATRAVIDRGALDGCQIVMLWTTDEEIGSKTSRALIEAEATRSEAVLVLEPSLPGGGLKTSRKGVGLFEMIARGVSAHAGLDPGKGVSAVRELARQIIALDALQDPANGVTVTAGVVSGGTRANVVPAEARATIDARANTRADTDRVQRAMRSLTPIIPGATIE